MINGWLGLCWFCWLALLMTKWMDGWQWLGMSFTYRKAQRPAEKAWYHTIRTNKCNVNQRISKQGDIQISTYLWVSLSWGKKVIECIYKGMIGIQWLNYKAAVAFTCVEFVQLLSSSAKIQFDLIYFSQNLFNIIFCFLARDCKTCKFSLNAPNSMQCFSYV